MMELEKQFMEDPEFQQPEETVSPATHAQASATGTMGATSVDAMKASGKLDATASLRGSPTRGQGATSINEKSKKKEGGGAGTQQANAAAAKNKDAPEEVELEQTEESLEYAAFRN